VSAISFRYRRPDPASPARLGQITTPHGVIDTPAFIVVSAQAALKSLLPAEVADLGAQAVLCPTYHLALRPGADAVAELGGLHRFMDWPGPLLSDSASYQVVSLGFAKDYGIGRVTGTRPDDDLRVRRRPASAGGPQARLMKVDVDGVTFRSHLDGSIHRLTPEVAVETQEKLGADIIQAFDEPGAPLDDESSAALALERSHQWAVQSLAVKRRSDQGMYGVVAGGRFRRLREAGAGLVGREPFDGYVVGGTLGMPGRELDRVLSWTIPALPTERPRHLPGIGGPQDLFRGVEHGVDTFDSVAPVWHAQRGVLLTADGPLSIAKGIYREDDRPIDPTCRCPTCQTFSRAYVRHLFKADELLAATLATTHNLAYILDVMARIRKALAAGTLGWLRAEVLGRWAST
jgi:queuine tRNA-ribosyltransferase